MLKEKIIGIYVVINKIDHKMYIGQSIDICRRWQTHRNVNASVSKIDCFDFILWEKCERERLNEREILV